MNVNQLGFDCICKLNSPVEKIINMKKTILIGALTLALSACSEQPKENSNVIQVDIENANR